MLRDHLHHMAPTHDKNPQGATRHPSENMSKVMVSVFFIACFPFAVLFIPFFKSYVFYCQVNQGPVISIHVYTELTNIC